MKLNLTNKGGAHTYIKHQRSTSTRDKEHSQSMEKVVEGKILRAQRDEKTSYEISSGWSEPRS